FARSIAAHRRRNMSRPTRRLHQWLARTALLALLSQAATGQLDQNQDLLQDQFSPLLEAVKLPGKGLVRGLATLNGLTWLARGDALIAWDLDANKVVRERPAPEGLLGLAADTRSLYVLTRKGVHVFDAIAMEEVRQLLLPNAAGDGAPGGIACLGEHVYVATQNRH